MMLSHEIFDPEFGKRVLIDQAFIVAGGEITKQALNWARQRTRPDDPVAHPVTHRWSIPVSNSPDSTSYAW
jgi:hypothetical protein